MGRVIILPPFIGEATSAGTGTGTDTCTDTFLTTGTERTVVEVHKKKTRNCIEE